MEPEVLNPRLSAKDGAEYDARAKDLAGKFVKNFEQFKGVSPDILAAGPRV
jgi:phosphoenolpyruvate carboxykinase (ATP)